MSLDIHDFHAMASRVASIIPNTSVNVGCDTWLHVSRDGEVKYELEYNISIVPGLNGEKCTIFRDKCLWSAFEVCRLAIAKNHTT